MITTSPSKNRGTEPSWKQRLVLLVNELPPDRYKDLCIKFLESLGFIGVQLHVQEDDQFVEGTGVIELGILSQLFSFRALHNHATSTEIDLQNFRRSMHKKSDKGILLSTGGFDRTAKRARRKKGSVIIDLINGDEFAIRLKELKLGVVTHPDGSVEIDENFFKSL